MSTYVFPMLVFAAIGLASGILLTVCSKIFEVKVDERIETINEILPQVNCGACGFSGCSDYASAIVNNSAELNMCKPGGNDCARKIAAVMGKAAADVTPQAAVVLCGGDCTAAKSKYIFQGVQSCRAAKRFYNGSEVCTHGCLGLGDCQKVCSEGGIIIRDGLARIDKSKCIGCGKCTKVCPNNLIVLRDIGQKVDVCCSSTDNGKIVRSACSSGCIGCRLCEKKCPNGAVHVENNLARIDYDKCTACGICADACPTKAIRLCDMVCS